MYTTRYVSLRGTWLTNFVKRSKIYLLKHKVYTNMIHNSKTKQRKLRNQRNHIVYLEWAKVELEKNKAELKRLKDEQRRLGKS